MRGDFVRLNLSVQTVNLQLKYLKLEWPPPAYLHIADGGQFGALTQAEVDDLPPDELPHVMQRTAMSQITDEQITTMSHVARGAEYDYLIARP